jgi:ORF6N domain
MKSSRTLPPALNRDGVVPPGRVESVIFSIRGRRVILDSDLAKLDGVTTTRLNEQVRRNPGPLPAPLYKRNGTGHHFRDNPLTSRGGRSGFVSPA